MGEVIENRFGRRPGRGLRPWLLMPKVIAVAIYLGTLAATLGIWLAGDLRAMDAADPRRLWTIEQVSWLTRFLTVPALLLAMALGASLLLQHPRQFLRMRWLQVKLLSIAIVIPSAHFYCSSRLAQLRQAAAMQQIDDVGATHLTCGLACALAGSIWIVILGRLKPRLGQNWARSYAVGMPQPVTSPARPSASQAPPPASEPARPGPAGGAGRPVP